GRIVLFALHIWFYILRRYQLHVVAERLEQACPMVRSAAGLDRDQCWRQFFEVADHLGSSKLPPNNNFLDGVNTVQLKDGFRCIHTDTDGLGLHWNSPLNWRLTTRS